MLNKLTKRLKQCSKSISATDLQTIIYFLGAFQSTVRRMPNDEVYVSRSFSIPLEGRLEISHITDLSGKPKIYWDITVTDDATNSQSEYNENTKKAIPVTEIIQTAILTFLTHKDLLVKVSENLVAIEAIQRSLFAAECRRVATYEKEPFK